MKFHVIVMYVNESKRLMEIKQNPYLKTRVPRVRALGILVLVYLTRFYKKD